MTHLPLTRREMLDVTGIGFGGLAMRSLLADDGLLAAPPVSTNPLASVPSGVLARAKSVIFQFAYGGPVSYTHKPQPTSELV